MVCGDTLRIKHLPKELTDAQKEDFVRHFGAIKVKVITSKAKATSVVYAKFESQDVAKNVLLRLHQLNILNCRLSVEYAETDILQGALAAKKITDLKDVPDQRFFKNFINNINAFNDSVGFHQPPPSHLKYNYPKANRSTINNIAHALATIPRFYTQVLHLMNKMNLPPPFAMPEPPVRIIQPSQHPVTSQKVPENIPEKRKESSSESEIESDGESSKNTEIIPQKRTLPQKKVVKRPKFIKQAVPLSVPTKAVEKPEDIFDMVNVQQPRKIELRVMPELPQEPEPGPEPQKLEPAQKQITAEMKNLEPKVTHPVQLIEKDKQHDVKQKLKVTHPVHLIEKDKKPDVKEKLIEKPKEQQKLIPKRPVPAIPASEISYTVDKVLKDELAVETPKEKVVEPIGPKTPPKIADRVKQPSPKPNQNILVMKKSEEVQPNIQYTPEEAKAPQKVKLQEPLPIHDRSLEMPQEYQQPNQQPKEVLQIIQQVKPVKISEILPEPSSPEDEYPCISLEELAANQVTDLSVMTVFKKYNPGEPTNKLYIKNCAKTVAVQDLEYIYNRYREEGTEDKPSEFNIRLMQEGRMKGQAFVTLDSVEMAQKAVTETNGFILKDKPLVVVFGKAGKKK